MILERPQIFCLEVDNIARKLENLKKRVKKVKK